MGPPAPKTDPECVRVVVRCRPLNRKEKEDNRERIVDMDKKAAQVVLRSPGNQGEPPKAFTFDAVFDWESTQKEVYDYTARGIVNSVMEGYNGTIFAYGQTGTGKTHTMDGYSSDPEQQGIIPNSFVHIFNAIEASSDVQYLVRASFLEIYNEEIRDLLSKDPKQKLDLKEAKDSGVYVKGLNAFVVKSIPEIRNVLEAGKKNRSVGATLMNQDSSRSHSVFTITIETLQQGPSSDGHIRAGKLNLVDLAGSERQSKTGATGDRLKEATKINLSLSALGNVISALVDGKTGHVPYRDSKLTRLLQDSLGGNTKTVMMAAVGPADWNYDETLSTLRYASRAKNITNKPKINEDPKDAMLREFQDEIKRLKAQLEAIEGGGTWEGGEDGGGGGGGGGERVVQVARPLAPEEIERMRAQIEEEVRAEMTAAAGNQELDQAQLDQVAAEIEARAAAEAVRLEEEARKAQEAAAKYSRQQKAMEEKIAKTAEEAQRQKEEKEALQAKLRAMEGKLIKGEAKGGLLALTQAKEQEIARREAELAKRRAEEAARAEEIAELEGMAAAAEGRFATLAEEAEAKTRKLKKLLKKFKEVDTEVSDLYSEFQREKEDLLDSIRQLHQQMLLKDAVIAAFIPQEEVQKVVQRAQWNQEEEAWQLASAQQQAAAAPLRHQQQPDADSSGQPSTSSSSTNWGPAGRPIATPNSRVPLCALTKAAIAAGDMNPRFRNENLLALELDIPERATFDIIPGQGPDPRAQSALDATFWQDGMVLVVGGTSRQQNIHLLGPGSPGGKPGSPGSPMRGSPVGPGALAGAGGGGVMAGSHQQRPGSSGKRRPGSAARPPSSMGRPV